LERFRSKNHGDTFKSAPIDAGFEPDHVKKILLNQIVITADYDLSNLETNNHLNLFN